MELVKYTLGFILLSGLIGFVSLRSGVGYLSAHKSIDHPSKTTRGFFRLMAFFFCQFWSFFLTGALLGSLPIREHAFAFKQSPEPVQALLIFVVPLPLTALLYLLYVKMVRWVSRREHAR
jgi:hypothetical protein